MKKKQVQSRLTKAIVPKDKLSNHPFSYPPDEYKAIVLNYEQCGCIEGEDSKGKKIETPYWLSLVSGYVDLKPLTPFHRELLFTAISAYEQGYRVLTFNMTTRALTGDPRAIQGKKFYEAIKMGFDKLLFTRIKIDLSPLLEAFPKYGKRYTGTTELVSPLLPGRYFETQINGQKTLAIELLGSSPIMTVANLKRQVISYDTAILNIPNQNNTETVVVIKNYLLRRISLMPPKGRLNKSILFETLLRECGLADADRFKKRDVRKTIGEVLEHFKAENVIRDFEFELSNGTYRAIKITTLKPAQA